MSAKLVQFHLRYRLVIDIASEASLIIGPSLGECAASVGHSLDLFFDMTAGADLVSKALSLCLRCREFFVAREFRESPKRLAAVSPRFFVVGTGNPCALTTLRGRSEADIAARTDALPARLSFPVRLQLFTIPYDAQVHGQAPVKFPINVTGKPWTLWDNLARLLGRVRTLPHSRPLQSHCRGQGFDSPQLHQPARRNVRGTFRGR